MGTVSLSLPSDGTTADVADYNVPITTLANEFNGNIDDANIKTGAAIATSKLADDSGVTYAKVAAGFVVQVVGTNSTAVATGTTTIPLDDSIPQNTEGDEYLTQAITPKSATNILVIEATLMLANSASLHEIVALFQDSTANALAAIDHAVSTDNPQSIKLTYQMVAGTTSSTTFKIRAGGSSAGTTTFNGRVGARLFGAITKSHIKVTEYKA